jgi:DNA invertase Pin-like site-specific DNA recombinase
MAGKAYSYQRCSNVEQVRGDTKRRQAEPLLTRGAEYCRRNGLTLDETHTFADWGISSFHGDNVAKGALGVFLAAIDKKIIGKGDVLIVEAIDRLTRLPLDDADQLLRRILKAGVSIVTLNPEFEIAPDALNDLGKRMMLLAYCEVAHRSSADKSKWLCSAWDKKRRDATHTNKKMTKSCPRWLELSEDRTHFIEIPEAVTTVKMIFRWYLDGLGAHTITLRLNRERIPALGKGKHKRQHWHEANVQKLLSNIAVTGRFQLHKGTHDRSTPVGDPIPTGRPAAIRNNRFASHSTRR